MTDSISAEDHELLESTRKVNKVLHLLVMALQEQSSRIPTESQFSVAAMLTTLADDIRERASKQAAGSAARRSTKREAAGFLRDGAAVMFEVEARSSSTEPSHQPQAAR